jgi:hypothetical protein
MFAVRRAVCHAGVVGVVGVAACSHRDAARATDTASARDTAAAVVGTVIRATVASDSAAAAELVDSLAREGWEAESGPPAAGDSGVAVNVVVPGDRSLAESVSNALRQHGLQPSIVGARRARRDIGVEIIAVNHGTHGISAPVRWVLSGDRRGLLVVEDPRGVENDPLPNGFVFAREGAPVVQRDSVWDVAISPDWRRLAYARAYTTRAGESDSVPASEWRRLAGRVGLKVSVVRRNAFPTSGMVAAYGVARTFVIDFGGRADSGRAPDVPLPIAEGWRLAWNADGSRLAVGTPADVIADDGQAARWRLVDPGTGDSRGVADAGSLARVQWVEGPILDVSTALDMTQRQAFRAGDVDVESDDGWIRTSVRDGKRLSIPRIVGPGIALTTTANGQFVVAIVPNPSATSYDPPNHLIVYRILRR